MNLSKTFSRTTGLLFALSLLSVTVAVSEATLSLPAAAAGAPIAPSVEANAPPASPSAEEESCVDCHTRENPALVMEWQVSTHFQEDVGCKDCHQGRSTDEDAWEHGGTYVAVLVTPKDCAKCHRDENKQFAGSHHARAGEIIASLDNMMAEKIIGMPSNNADAVNGCWQCHGSIVAYQRDEAGNIVRSAEDNKPILNADTWPNSGMGRLNPDGSKGTCNACHARHSFDAKLSRAPENCGKCHLGPDHPQIEIYNESKHGIAFYANRDRMALDTDGDWVLGRDYSAAPTCASCHISSYMTPDGVLVGNTHDVGERISWTLRPVISSKLNSVVYADGYREDFPESRELPAVGDKVETTEKVAENETLVSKPVTREVAEVITWEQRREKMVGACRNCHSDTHIENFYAQFDSLVELYNEKYAKPAQQLMNELTADGVLDPAAPFTERVHWVFWELWHHEGRRARHGASMMGPDYTHWHGMYEVSKHFYLEFLPAVVEAAEKASPEMGEKYQQRVAELLAQDEHLWLSGLSPEEAEEVRKMYQERYGP